MTKPRRSRNRAITAAITAGALLIGGAVVALAVDPTAPTITGGPAQNAFTNNPSPAFTFADGDGGTAGNGSFLWAFDGAPSNGPEPAGTVTPASPLTGEGNHEFRVLETATAPDNNSPVTTRTFFLDTVKPAFSRVLSPGSPGASGWYTGNVTINLTCETQSSTASGVASCADIVLDTDVEDGVYNLAAATVTDRAGNVSDPEPPLSFKRDSTDPVKPTLVEPLSITNVVTPTFTWARVDDVTPTGVTQVSEVKEYLLTIRSGATPNAGTVVHQTTVAQTLPTSGGQVTYTAVPNLTNGSSFNWTVRAVDFAGNTNTSAAGVFSVDTTAPDDPTFSAGPTNGQATNDSTPTFSFTGVPGATFTWETRNNLDALVPGAGFAGSGSQNSVTLPTLPDGTYTFKVRQTAPNLKVSGFGSALFTVDTTAPTAPAITSSPGTTGNAQPSFGWSASEQDGTFVWEVTGVGGLRVLGPGDAATSAIQLSSPLTPGNYAFRVRQRDRAGNVSDWSAPEPFTIIAPPSGGTGGNNDPGTGVSRFRPSTRNAKALLPKVGAKVRPAAATLRWKRAKGATLYNLQVFRIDGTTYRKVHSAFPRGLRYTIPKRVLKANKRYVWRVWPYVGAKRRYTPAPLGISWFDTP